MKKRYYVLQHKSGKYLEYDLDVEFGFFEDNIFESTFFDKIEDFDILIKQKYIEVHVDENLPSKKLKLVEKRFDIKEFTIKHIDFDFVKDENLDPNIAQLESVKHKIENINEIYC